MSCPFCDQEVLGKQCFFETENEHVIQNKIPIVPGHVLVIPKRHVSSIQELNEDEIKSLFNTVKLVSKKIKEHYSEEGFNVAFNDGTCAGQTVPHLHVHILSRKPNDMNPDPRNLYYRIEKDREELSKEELRNKVTSLKELFD